jgi:hypothetical protein
VSDTFISRPRSKAPSLPQDNRPFIVVSHADERYRVICCNCGQRLINQGLGKTFACLDPEKRDPFRLLMLALEVRFADCGHRH